MIHFRFSASNVIKFLVGFQRFGGVTCMKKKHYSSFIREPRADYQHIKSIRRPLAPESSRPTTQSSILQFKDGSSIPQAIKREIVRRQTLRLETKRQELLDQDKQRRMQLEDTVGVYTRISLSKGSLKHRPTVRLGLNDQSEVILIILAELFDRCFLKFR